MTAAGGPTCVVVLSEIIAERDAALAYAREHGLGEAWSVARGIVEAARIVGRMVRRGELSRLGEEGDHAR